MIEPTPSSSSGDDANRREQQAGGSGAMQTSASSSSSQPSSSPPPSSPPVSPPRSSPHNNNDPSTSSCTACAGITVYSRAHHDAGKPPSCLGVSRTRRQSGADAAADAATEPTLLPPDVAPGGDFKFFCLGYAVCRDNANSSSKKKKAERERGAAAGAGPNNSNTSAEDDDVELPACLGIQIIRAAAATPAAMPMRGVGALSNDKSSGAKQQPRRAPLARANNAPAAAAAASPAPPGLPELGASLLDAADRFERSARRVAARMGSNLVAIFGGGGRE